MAVNTGSNKKALSEINVTPLVDVMLVLLVVFMITAPMLEQGIDLDLPEVRAQALPQNDASIELHIRADGDVYLDGNRVPDDRLRAALTAIAKNRPDEPIYVNADRSVPYGRVATVLSTVRKSGSRKLHLVTQEPDRR